MRVRILGIVILCIGFVVLFFGNYIANQIEAGKEQIQSGQSQINTYKNIFSINPVSKQVGNQMMKPYEERISRGQTEITEYEALVIKLRIAGVILIIIGLALALIWGSGSWGRRSLKR